MLKTILSISGKPGLYKLISQGKNMLIVESLVDKKRFPAYGNEKIISLGDIAMYTDTEEVPLKDVLLSMKKKENGAAVALDVKKASVKVQLVTKMIGTSEKVRILEHKAKPFSPGNLMSNKIRCGFSS